MHKEVIAQSKRDEPECPGHKRHYYRDLELIYDGHKYKNGLWKPDRKTTCRRCGTIQLAYYSKNGSCWRACWLEREVEITT